MRAGRYALSLLSVPLNVHVLKALGEGPKSLIVLRRAVGSPPQTTMRGHLRTLIEAGIVERRRQSEFPGSVDYELTRSGQDLLGVASVLQHWLAASPDGPLELGTPAAKSSIRALTEGWSTGVIRALAARSLSLTELSGLITRVSYPSLERRLGAMRLAGQIERCSGNGRGTPYSVTDWLRGAIAPLAAAARWERLNLPAETPPIRRLDVEAAFLLVVPLLRLPEDRNGICRLGVELRSANGELRFAGVSIGIDKGRVTSCVARPEGEADAWASGPAAAWLRAAIDGHVDLLEVGGDCDLALTLIDAAHGALFSGRTADSLP